MRKIAITMGDPGGIGAEVIIKALFSSEIHEYCTPIIFGDRLVIEEAIKLLNMYVKLQVISSPEECKPSPGTIQLIPVGETGDFQKAKATESGGHACVSYIKKAVELAQEKRVDALVTAPISKEALHIAGYSWPGHTEMIAELTGTKEYAMMLVGGLLRIILVTIHTAIRKVPDQILKDTVLKTIRLAKKACDMMGITDPRIAVAGLNPHAGEAGLFGDEESREILPAIEEAVQLGIPVTGPFPPDSLFHRAYRGEIDIIVCMYHDQGLIPLKMISFDEGVNVTIGLPIIRTSPDHGTAYPIAWQGKANPSSMLEAIKFASRLRI
jgi:4-hydroxythreonine-4-phosphate dehydrogenase